MRILAYVILALNVGAACLNIAVGNYWLLPVNAMTAFMLISTLSA